MLIWDRKYSNAFSHDQIMESRSTVEKVNEYTNNLLETVNTPVLKTTSFKVKEKSKFNWNILLSILLFLLSLFVSYLVFKTWQKKRTLVNKTVSPEPWVLLPKQRKRSENC
jgi:hypothetical protein